MTATPKRPGGTTRLLLKALGDGPRTRAELGRVTAAADGTVKNRLSEMRAHGWIEDTVTLTPEGKRVLDSLDRRDPTIRA